MQQDGVWSRATQAMPGEDEPGMYGIWRFMLSEHAAKYLSSLSCWIAVCLQTDTYTADEWHAVTQLLFFFLSYY